VRVAHDIAGKKWGEMHIPRIGQEVIVDFIEGDPDQPIITGSVYNNLSMPHYELPKYKTLTYLKTRTTPDDGKGFNELRFEDKQGKEQVFIHSQRRMDVRVRQSLYETCGGNRQEVIGMRSDNKPGGNLAITVGGNYDLHVVDSMFIGIQGKRNEIIKGDVIEKYNSNQQTAVRTKAELNAREITLEALTKITLKVGPSFIVVDLTGVTIQGPIVKINSGGAATGTGPGEGALPLDAETADTGEPGYLDRPRRGGSGGGRVIYDLNGQHAPENITRNEDGSYQMGAVKVVGTPEYQQAVLSDLATINTTTEGSQLLNNLNTSGRNVTIHAGSPPPNPPNAFAGPVGGDFQNATPAGQPVFNGAGRPVKDASGNQLLGTGRGTDSDVTYNPEQWTPGATTSGAPGDVILFHELTHSDHQTHGQHDGTPRTDGFTTNEEFNTIRPENRYRDERRVPNRTDHGDL
jgi:hypothetical protein